MVLVLLGRRNNKALILLKSNLWKIFFSNFAIIFDTMNGHTYKLVKILCNDAQTEYKVEINTD